MTVSKVWMSPDTAKQSRYGLRTLGGVIGIAALLVLLVLGGTVLSFALDLPREIFSLVLVCGTTALAAMLGYRLGWRSVRDATVFFLTEDDRLFVLDARTMARHGLSVLSYAEGMMETQAFLRRLAEHPFVPRGAVEIVKVERMRENRTYCAIRCQVRGENRRVTRCTCFLVRGLAQEELLLRQLERRLRWQSAWEDTGSRNLRGVVFSAAALAGFAALCVFSHPAQGRLPQAIYFPCLGAAFAACAALACFVIRYRRGE